MIVANESLGVEWLTAFRLWLKRGSLMTGRIVFCWQYLKGKETRRKECVSYRAI